RGTISNALTSRVDSVRQLLFDPRRNYENEAGYPCLDESINVETYRQLFDRDSVANRAVSILPKESWRISPQINETDDPGRTTQFEKDWDEFAAQIGSTGATWYEKERGSAIWSYLLRLDILCGIGKFGVLLLGVDDGRNLAEPIEGVRVVTN